MRATIEEEATQDRLQAELRLGKQLSQRPASSHRVEDEARIGGRQTSVSPMRYARAALASHARD